MIAQKPRTPLWSGESPTLTLCRTAPWGSPMSGRVHATALANATRPISESEEGSNSWVGRYASAPTRQYTGHEFPTQAGQTRAARVTFLLRSATRGDGASRSGDRGFNPTNPASSRRRTYKERTEEQRDAWTAMWERGRAIGATAGEGRAQPKLGEGERGGSRRAATGVALLFSAAAVLIAASGLRAGSGAVGPRTVVCGPEHYPGCSHRGIQAVDRHIVIRCGDRAWRPGSPTGAYS